MFPYGICHTGMEQTFINNATDTDSRCLQGIMQNLTTLTRFVFINISASNEQLKHPVVQHPVVEHPVVVEVRGQLQETYNYTII